MVIFIHARGNNMIFAPVVAMDFSDVVTAIKCVMSQAVARCAVPAFFIMSAILLYRKQFSWLENVKKKAKTLLAPYFLINTIWIIFFIICGEFSLFDSFKFTDHYNYSDWHINDVLNAYCFNNFEDMPIAYPLWFLRNLFVLNVLAIIIKQVIDRFPVIMFLVLLGLWLLPPVFLGFYMKQSICFWCFGYYIVRYNVSLDYFDNKKLMLLCLYPAVIYLEFMFSASAWYFFFHYAECMIGVAFWFSLATNISNARLKKILLYLASFNICVYFFHEPAVSIIREFIIRMFPQTAFVQVAEYVLLSFILAFIAIIIGVIIKKICPSGYSIITGNR